ncbi:hypothetical protein T11_8789 [Trichinella zimbabwensis]|uniref:Uncharacterized protein n=1 Tax=Trichinella zimbabwensis TaxID=268475 RepID=A0A0V1HXY5_9BILA|nr:hypothetical protein T11_8789 [Trichinella zimbabwensis]
MSKMPPLLKCKHPGSVLREFQRGCFPNGIVFDESFQYPLMYRYLSKYYKKGENFEKKVFTKNAKTAKNFRKSYFPPKMTGIDLEKSQNYNEPGRTLHESSFVEIVA